MWVREWGSEGWGRTNDEEMDGGRGRGKRGVGKTGVEGSSL